MTAVAAPPRSPFKGLAPFTDSELDALFFFGRERERKLLVANLLAQRLTVLYGASGVGKSSLLGAAVLQDLRRAAPVTFRGIWSGELGDLGAEVAAGDGFLILDQFEEYFLYHGADAPRLLSEQLADLLATTDVNVLISLREDALAHLSAFKARIPGVFANQFRLQHLDLDQARLAILGPLSRWTEVTGEDVDAEPGLVAAVIGQVSADGGRVEAPYLQLVLERVWDAERDAGSPLLRRETLDRLGGASAIVREQFRGALEALPPEQQDTAAALFERLVTPSGTKIALRTADLAEYAHAEPEVLDPLLDRLTRERIVHAVDGSDRYEIFHDVLAEPITAWRLERTLARERAAAQRRQRRLAAVALAALAALALVAALAVWALSERSGARSQARHARANELLARSAQQLAVDPRLSVALALAAARLEPNAAAESTLRQALIADRLRTTLHVSRPVESVAAAPTGDAFAAVSGPKAILVGDLGTGRVTRRLHGAGPYTSVGFADPHTVVAATQRGVAALWRLPSGAPLPQTRRLGVARAHDGHVVLVPYQGALARALPNSTHVRATPDGAFVAAAVKSGDGRVRAWIFGRHGRLLHVLPDIGIHGIDISPDGRTVATASALGNATIWNLRTGRRVHVFTDSADSVADVAFNPPGSLLASTGTDGGVRIWTVADRTRLYFFPGQARPDGMLAWSRDGRLVAAANRDNTVGVWGIQGLVEDGGEVAALAGGDGSIHSMAFAADGRRLVAGSDDAAVRVWDSSPDQELRTVARFRKPVVGAVFAGQRIVAASADGTVDVRGARTRRFHAPAPVSALAASKDGAVVVAGSTAFDAASGRALSHVGGDATAVAIDPSGRLAVAGSSDGRVRAWQTHDGGVRWTAQQTSRVSDVRFSPDGSLVAVADGVGATIRSAATGQALHKLPVTGGVVRLAFSPDGKLLAAADTDTTARIWFVRAGKPYRVLRGHTAPLTDVSFSSDSALLATASQDSESRIWNVAQGRSVHVLRGHFGEVGAIAFSPDRHWIVTGGPISAGLWPTSTGRLLFYLRGDTALLTTVSFSPDGRTILSGSLDKTVRTYRCNVCGGLHDLLRLATRALAGTR